MIILTKLNGEKFMLNPDLIEIVTENPDTVITTSTGHSYIVEQSMNEILFSHQGIQAVCKTSASRAKHINCEYYSRWLCYINPYRRKLF